MTGASYRVELTLGDLAWTRTIGDAPVLPELLDGMTVGWQFPDADLWPVQPEPTTASFSILAAAAADLAGIDIGTRAHLQVYAGAVDAGLNETPTVRLAGRVTQLDGKARRFKDPGTGTVVEGWQLDVQLADYTADTSEITVTEAFSGGVEQAGEYLRGLIRRYGGAQWVDHQDDGTLVVRSWSVPGPTDPPQGDGVQESPTVAAEWAFDPGDSGWGPSIAGSDSVGSMADAVESVLSIWPDAGDPGLTDAHDPYNHPAYAELGWRRGVWRANVDASGIPDAHHPWRIEWVSRRHKSPADAGSLPLTFVHHVDGTWGPELPDTPGPDGFLLDADYLDYGASWSRTKTTEPNRVVLTSGIDGGTWSKVTRSETWADQQPVTATLDGVPIVDAYWAGNLADMYNGDPEAPGASRWTLGQVTWLASRDPSWPRNLALFPDAPRWAGHSTPVVLAGIPDTYRPAPGPYVAGPVKAVDFTITSGGFSFDLTLYPRVPRPANNAAALSWANVTGPTWAQLDGSTWADYRLIHTTDAD